MKAFAILIFVCLSTISWGQHVVEISNILCDDNNDPELSFDITWTEDGTPVEASDSGMQFYDLNNNLLFNTETHNEIDNVSTSGYMENEVICADVLGQRLRLDNNDDNPTSSTLIVFKEGSVAIPTMGQWALLILGLILTSMAVVRIKKRSASID